MKTEHIPVAVLAKNVLPCWSSAAATVGSCPPGMDDFDVAAAILAARPEVRVDDDVAACEVAERILALPAPPLGLPKSSRATAAYARKCREAKLNGELATRRAAAFDALKQRSEVISIRVGKRKVRSFRNC